MQQFQIYPLSTLRKPDRYHVDDDNNLSRITSNDSGISYDDSDDSESLFSIENDFDLIDSNINITEDGKKSNKN
jgi:hypothetical protein